MKIPGSVQIAHSLFLALLLASILHTAHASPPPTTSPGTNGKIAFASSRDGNYEIYVMDADGANQTRLVGSFADDFSPVWSPDGTKIAFTNNSDGTDKVYVMQADGSNRINLTNNPANNSLPAWSPDGTRIAFMSNRDGNREVYTMDANGSNPINLTNNPSEDLFPKWSPDGAKIAFTSNRDGNYEIYVMDANGSNPIRLTNSPASDDRPAWSPDGTKIAFSSFRDGNYEIYAMNADGSNQTRLTNNPFEDSYSGWSPDGSRIAFSSRRAVDHNYEVYTMEANGANPVNLSQNPAADYGPDWQRIAGTPSPTPTQTPAPSPAQALNISTRMRVEAGDNVLIGGFIILGNAPKSVAVRGIGPSLGAFGINDTVADPTLELHDSSGATLVLNDNWQDDPAQAAQLTALGLALQNPNESGIVIMLQPNAAYTAIVSGRNGGTGVGLMELYDTNPAADSQLANISTRGFVQTGNNVMIGGFILGGANGYTRVVVRGIGPSLAQFGVNPVLADPVLELHDNNGVTLISNDNWLDNSTQAARLTELGLGLQDFNESGIFASLPPGAYTAVLAGKNGGTGIGLVEIYNVH